MYKTKNVGSTHSDNSPRLSLPPPSHQWYNSSRHGIMQPIPYPDHPTSVYLHLTPNGFLSRAGKSDSINDTIDYGSLTKAVLQYLGNKENKFGDIGELIDGVVERAFEAAGEKFASLWSCPSWFLWRGQDGSGSECNPSRSIRGKDLFFSVGVRDPERNEKQRIVVNPEVSK